MRRFLTIALLTICFGASAQFTIKIGDDEFKTGDIGGTKFKAEIKKISIKKDDATTPAKDFFLSGGDDDDKPFKTDGAFHELQFTNDVRNKTLSIKDDQNNDLNIPFVLPSDEASDDSNGKDKDKTGTAKIKLPKDKTAKEYILNRLFPSISDVEGQGLKIMTSTRNTRYGGAQYIHLFFDQNILF